MELRYQEIAHGSNLYWQSVELRDLLLRKPLGLAFSEEELLQEVSQFHLAGIHSNVVKAILCLKPIANEIIKMRQVAVDSSLQQQGQGKLLVKFAEKFARNKGFKSIVLHARESVVPFYKKMAYSVKGNSFTEVSLPHFYMEKRLI